MRKSVLLAFSGGVDSTAAAILLKQQGFDVTAIHFYFTKSDQSKNNELTEAAHRLGVKLIEQDLTAKFSQQVFPYFTQEYLAGRTPCPCSYCNLNIKWRYLYESAIKQNFSHIATGHYVRTTTSNNMYRIQKGVDAAKDQSYFLWNLPQEYISKSIMPLGNLLKHDVKQLVAKAGFNQIATKPESMGVCFLRGNDYRTFIEQQVGNASIKSGNIVDENGNVVGEHNGLYNYTIGQKRGIKGLPKNKCVTYIDKENNQIHIGLWDSLFYNTLKFSNCTFNGLSIGKHNNLDVLIRGFGKNPQQKAMLILHNDKSATVELADPAWAPTPGQPAAIYQKDILLGGGYLHSAWNRTE